MSKDHDNSIHYNEGYDKGKHWKIPHVPGGPFVCDEKTRKSRQHWIDGFHDGLEVNVHSDSEAIKTLRESLYS